MTKEINELGGREYGFVSEKGVLTANIFDFHFTKDTHIRFKVHGGILDVFEKSLDTWVQVTKDRNK